MKHKFVHASLLVLSFLLFIAGAYGVEDPGSLETTLEVEQKLGGAINLDAEFTDSSGSSVSLKEYFHRGVPVLFTPVYFECPRLCTLVLNGVIDFLRETNLILGQDFRIVTVSFDPSESTALAKAKASTYFDALDGTSHDPDAGWHFLTGEAAVVRELMQSVGFSYFREGSDYAHSAVLVLLTPEGKISRYFFGITFSARDLRLALVEASGGAVGSFVDQVLLYCFRFDPLKGKYTPMVLNIVRLAGTIILLALSSLLWFLWRRYGRAPREALT